MLKKLLTLISVLVFNSVYGQYEQGNISHSDSANRKFILFINCGLSIPEAQYRVPTLYATYPWEDYQDNIQGIHINATMVFLPIQKTGIAARFGMDWNYFPGEVGSDHLTQYMVGLYQTAKPKDSRFNFHFMGLIGLVAAKLGHGFGDNNGNYTTYEIPAHGVGVGIYVGVGVSFRIVKRLYVDVSAGYFDSWVSFPNGTRYAISNYPPQYEQVTNSPMNRNLGVILATAGLHFYL